MRPWHEACSLLCSMKWVYSTLWLVAILLSASHWARAERTDPFAFGNLAILTFENQQVNLLRTDDGRGVVLLLDTWSPALEALVRASFGGSGSLSLRMLPKQQAQMAIEVFSASLDIDYAVRRDKSVVQVMIGELRPERRMLEMLSIEGGLELLPKSVITAIEAGQLAQARGILTGAGRESPVNAGYLTEARIAALEATVNGAALAKCPPAPPSITTVGLQQGLLLAAWCEIAAERTDIGLRHLDALLDRPDTNQYIHATATRMKRRVTSARVFAAERAGAIIAAANDYLQSKATIPLEGASPYFFERLGQLLMQAGVGHLFATASKVALSSSSDEEMLLIAPISAEALWNAGEEVRALDVAQYFERDLRSAPPWVAGRLRRVLGLAALRSGHWSKALLDLEQAKTLLGGATAAEELAIQEARLSGGTPAAEVLPALQAQHEAGAQKSSRWMDRWLSRLWGETWLRLGKLPSDAILSVQPGYVLYQGAEAARAAGRQSEADHLYEMAAKNRASDGWSELSAVVLEAQATAERLDEIRKGMEVLP